MELECNVRVEALSCLDVVEEEAFVDGDCPIEKKVVKKKKTKPVSNKIITFFFVCLVL